MRPPKRDKKFSQQSSFQKPVKKFKDSIQKATQFDKTKKKFFKTDSNTTDQQGGQFKKNTFSKEGNSYPKKRYGESSEGQYGKKKYEGGSGGFGPKKRYGESSEGQYGKKKYEGGSGSFGPKKRYGESSEGQYGKKKFEGGSGGFGPKKRYGESSEGQYGKKKFEGGSGGFGPKKRYGESSEGQYGKKKFEGGSGGFGPKKRYGESSEGQYGKKKYEGGSGGFGPKKRYGESSEGQYGKKKYEGGGSGFGFKKRYEKPDSEQSSDFKKRTFEGKFKPKSNFSGKFNKPFQKSEGYKPYREEDAEQKNTWKKQEGEEQSSFRPKNKFQDRQKPYQGKNSGASYQKPRFSKTKDYEAANKNDGSIRLNRFIANAGICSRREADELILAGRIMVNHQVINEMGYKVQPGDVVKYDGKTLKANKLVYVLLNKPKDFITTTYDPEGRKTVMDLVRNATQERIYPVGRLDRNTTGLLLFTNDGELAEKLSHPSHEVKKVYLVELDKSFTREDYQSLLKGVTLEDGVVKIDKLDVLSLDSKFIGIEIHSGKNRVVRRIFEHYGYEVVRLDRTMYAGLSKKDLPRGNWRHLSEKEIIFLKHFA